MSTLSLIRHQEIFDASKFQHIPIHIIGCGATGSRVWLSLVELGLDNLHAWDFDKVEPHNLPNQIFLNQHIGMLKVNALIDYYYRKTGQHPPETMSFNDVKFGPDTIQPVDISGIVFLLTDTMASRREIFSILQDCSAVPLIIETRMASSYGDVKTINPFDQQAVDTWLASLTDDDQAEVSSCGASISVGPTAAIIANLAVWQLIQFLNSPGEEENSLNIHLRPTMLSLN
jgi:molybdopterin/thiamine biosynthesis adenylyltransferase